MTPGKRGALDVDRRTLARILGMSLRTLATLEGEGKLTPKRRGRGGRPSLYALDEAVPAYLAQLSRAPSTTDEKRARARRDEAVATLTEIRIKREAGELVPRDQVVREGCAFVKATVAKLNNLPARLVRAGAIPRSAERAAADVVREAREEMARWQNILDLQQAIDEEAATAAGRTP